MIRTLRAVRRVYDADDAIAATEYALMLGLVALMLFLVMAAFGTSVKAQWQKVSAVFHPPACDVSNGAAPTQNPNCQ